MLKNIKILDFSKLLPAPLGTQLLATMGATIWKVERPQSPDGTRFQEPFVGEISTIDWAINDGKELLKLDFAAEEGRNLLLDYVRQADVLVEQFRPNVMNVWKLDYETLKQINPNLIYISVTGYGQSGTYAQEPGHDLNFLSLSGLMDLMRDENGKPIVPNVQIGDVAGGSYQLVIAVLAALLERTQTQQGKFIDISMTKGAMPLMTLALAQYWGGLNCKEINVLAGGLVNYNTYQCADKKWVVLAALELKFWTNFCKANQRPDWQRQYLGELSIHVFPKAEVEALFLTKTQQEWAVWALGKDVCLTPVVELEQWETSTLVQENVQIQTSENGLKKAIWY